MRRTRRTYLTASQNTNFYNPVIPARLLRKTGISVPFFRLTFLTVLFLLLASSGITKESNSEMFRVETNLKSVYETEQNERLKRRDRFDDYEPVVKKPTKSETNQNEPGQGANESGQSTGLTLIGRLLADYRTEQKLGFIALEDRMGFLHLIKEKNILTITKEAEPFSPLSKKEIEAELKKEFGPSFKIQTTSHFLLVSNTSNSYAAWCGRLFETLYKAFDSYQNRKGFTLPDNDIPMIALIFNSRKEFEQFAEQDAPGTKNVAAYYHRIHNRIVLYDLSNVYSSSSNSRNTRKLSNVEAILNRPQAAFNVATIIHEATHQISFNRGMFLRTGPFPLWMTEGMAMYFETPDAGTQKGWSARGVKRPNDLRLNTFNQFIATRPINPFQNVIQQEVFRTMPNAAYAVSWALFYYLNEKKPKQMLEYTNFLAKKIPFTVYTPEERLKDFETFFVDTWPEFYNDFNKFYRSIR